MVVPVRPAALGAPLLAVACCCGAAVTTPTVRPEATTVTALGAAGLTLRLRMVVENPNGVDLTVRSVRARVSARGRDLGTVEDDSGLRLAARQETPFEAVVTVSWLDVPGLGLGAVLGGAVPYHVEGVVVVSGPAGLSMEVPFEMDGEVPRSMLVPVPGLG